jgi:hypothetical protein
MKYTEEEFIKDGISGLNIKIKQKDFDERDKMAFVKFYEKNLKDNLDPFLEFNEGLKNIILYVYKNIKTINTRKGIYSNIFEGGGNHYEIYKDLKSFLEDNKNTTFYKSTNSTIYLEKFYFELTIEKKRRRIQRKIRRENKRKN